MCIFVGVMGLWTLIGGLWVVRVRTQRSPAQRKCLVVQVVCGFGKGFDTIKVVRCTTPPSSFTFCESA